MTGDRVLMDADSPAAKEVWSGIAIEARRRRLAIEIRDGSTDHPYRVAGKERSGVEWKGGDFDTLDQAFAAARVWVMEHPLPGPTALRDELRDHGRRLAILTPRDVSKKAGADFPLYRRFRDRILPLAFDNLVDATRLETFEEAARAVVEAYDQRGQSKKRSSDLAAAVATLRGLVNPERMEEEKPS